MTLDIKVNTNNSCKVVIQDNSEYLPGSFQNIVKGKFKFSDTFSIDVLLHNKVKETVYKSYKYTKHDTISPIEIPVEFDGWFTVIHIVLPSKDWFDNELSKTTGSTLGLYNIVYFTDGVDIYKYINNKVTLIDIDEIIEINSVDTTISKTSSDYVSICFLRKCYINLCLLIFDDRGFSSCWNKNKIDSELVYKRDLVWMAINVIKYLTKCEQLNEVERIIETITSCNGLCTSTLTNKTSGCGCSK